MSDSAILHFHNVSLYQHDVETIKDGEWLNDTMIEFYMECMEHEVIPKNASIMLLRPAIAHLIAFSSDKPQQLAPVLPPKLNQYEAIFMPINDGDPNVPYSGSHWSLLVFIRSACTFYYFDSMGASNIQEAKQSAQRIAPLLTSDESADFVPVATPQQTNGADCGAWVIAIMDYLVHELLLASQSGEALATVMSFDAKKLKSPNETRMLLQWLITSVRKGRS